MCVLTLILNTEMTMQNSEQTTSVESSLQKKKFLNTNKPLFIGAAILMSVVLRSAIQLGTVKV